MHKISYECMHFHAARGCSMFRTRISHWFLDATLVEWENDVDNFHGDDVEYQFLRNQIEDPGEDGPRMIVILWHILKPKAQNRDISTKAKALHHLGITSSLAGST